MDSVPLVKVREEKPTAGPKFLPVTVIRLLYSPNWEPVEMPVITGPSYSKDANWFEVWPSMATWIAGVILFPVAA
jgi:hypothetical protein